MAATCRGDGDQGLWGWEPAAYVHTTGRLDPDPDLRETGTHVMFDIVARVLATGVEDAALMLNDDYLLLARMDGVTTKHRRTWWDHYGWPNQVIPG